MTALDFFLKILIFSIANFFFSWTRTCNQFVCCDVCLAGLKYMPSFRDTQILIVQHSCKWTVSYRQLCVEYSWPLSTIKETTTKKRWGGGGKIIKGGREGKKKKEFHFQSLWLPRKTERWVLLSGLLCVLGPLPDVTARAYSDTVLCTWFSSAWACPVDRSWTASPGPGTCNTATENSRNGVRGQRFGAVNSANVLISTQWQGKAREDQQPETDSGAHEE